MNFTFLLGVWLGMLQLPDANLPFQFEFAMHDGRPVMIIQNAEERIICDDITSKGDSLFIVMPLYNSEFHLKTGNSRISGIWINKARKTPAIIPFSAQKGNTQRFTTSGKRQDQKILEGKWETWFDVNTPDSSLAIGIFDEKNGIVCGTFLTESGDHRFLEGVIDGDSLKLSVFDGTHAWLYLARVHDKKIEGMYYSGNTYKAPFLAFRNDSVHLRNPNEITKAEGKITFRLPDADSLLVSSEDPVFQNKVKIIQIMGSWCPNCMDESVFLDSIYRARKEEGLEIIGLSFERTTDFRVAAANIKKLKKKLALTYPILVAGIAQKNEVERVLPGISGFFSYPTTLLIDRKGEIIKVSTGFSGPATGDYWLNYKKEFKRSLDRLLR